MRWTLKDSRVVGGMRAAHLSAPFSRAQIVLESDADPGLRLIVSRYVSASEVEGEQVLDEEWRALITTEEALELREKRVAARPHLALWLLRSAFPEREKEIAGLRAYDGAIAHEELHGEVVVAIVDESIASEIRENWSRKAFDRAWRLAGEGNWDGAATFADLAWLVDAHPSLRSAALYALTLEKTEGRSASEDVIALEVNSRGRQEVEQIQSLMMEYREQLCGRQGTAIVRPVVKGLFPCLERTGKRQKIRKWVQEVAERPDLVFPLGRNRAQKAA
jgi:hypothetical protein